MVRYDWTEEETNDFFTEQPSGQQTTWQCRIIQEITKGNELEGFWELVVISAQAIDTIK